VRFVIKSWKRRVYVVAMAVMFSVIVVPVAGAIPTNDDLDNALFVADGYSAAINNVGSTLEAGEANGSCEAVTADWSMWYAFTATSTGSAFLRSQIAVATKVNYMTVYEMTTVGPPYTLGSQVACAPGLNALQQTVAVTNGTTYAVRISGASADLGKDITLSYETTGTLAGTVTEFGTANPLSGITVQVLDTTGTALQGSATTAADGTWQAEVPTRDVIVKFSDGTNVYADQYYDNVGAKVDATVLTVLEGVTTSGIDAVLADAGSLSGAITSNGGAPLEGAAVSIYDTPIPSSPVKTSLTVADGTYSMVGVPPGDYFVRISHPDYFAEWYNDAPDYTTATIVTVSIGVDSVVNAALAPGGAISGVVTDDGGQPVEGILIDIYEAEGALKYQRITLADGSYDVPGMVAGTYAIFANADSGTPGAYRGEWWDDLAPGTPYASVGKITVAAGTDDTVNFILNRSVVSGTVTSAADSLPIQGVVVTLVDSLSTQVSQTTTDAAGTYAFETFGFSNPPLSVSFEATNAYFVDDASTSFAFAAGDKQVEDIVLSVDQQPPTIDPGQSFTVPENIAVSAIVGTVSGGDNNRADTVTWSITGGNSAGLFAIDTATGAIKTTAALDYETTNFFSLTVAISDGSAQASTNIGITVTDVDETIPSAGFTDTIGTLFEKSIDWMAFTGVTAGCNPPDNDLYCPDATVTRGQMAAFLVRALNLPAATKDYFTDDDNSIFEDAINRVALAGITRGCNPPENDLFCPTGTVTRGQMAAFLVRALGYTNNGGGNLFGDDDGSIFEADIDKLATAGVTRGCNPPDNDLFCPSGTVTRGQMAAFLFRALSG